MGHGSSLSFHSQEAQDYAGLGLCMSCTALASLYSQVGRLATLQFDQSIQFWYIELIEWTLFSVEID